ncbi:MAG: TonB-dependent receptor [Planctomycetota bacterium]|nr:TonB-dependent receptor [Planctomycetota bacterium]
MPREALPVLLASGLLASLAAGEPLVVSALGAGDVELLDARAWVESVTRRRQDVATAPAPVDVILIEDLLLSPASTVADFLRYVPGVDVYQLRHGQHEVGLRGYNGPFNSRLLVLIDDQQFWLPEFAGPIWSGTLFLSDLERIEVAKGPGSVTYGANAFGGVIALSSRPVPDAPRFIAVGRAGNPEAYEADATLSGPLVGRWYGKLSAGYLRLADLPGVESGLPYQPSPRNDENTHWDTIAWRARALLGYNLGGGWTTELMARSVHRDPWEVVDGAAQGATNVVNDDDLMAWELRGPWVHAVLTQRRSLADYRNLRAAYDPASDYAYLQFGFRDYERGARVQFDIEAGAHRLGIGVEVLHWRSTSNLWRYGAPYHDRSQWRTVSRTYGGVFAEDQWSLADDLMLTIGARADRDTRTGNQASPRLAINWMPRHDQYALLSYARGYRLPSPLESYEEDFFLKPSDDLDAETIHAVEAQWRLRQGRDLEASVGAFWNRANMTIWRVPLPGNEQLANFLAWVNRGMPANIGPGPFYQFTNLDNPYTVYGAEAGARVRVLDELALWANATWQRGRWREALRFASPGFDAGPPLGVICRYDYTVPRDANAPPEWKANAGAEWQHEDGWFAVLAGRFVSGRFVYDYGHTRLVRDPMIGLQELEPYIAADLALGYRFGRNQARFVRLSVLDLFDSSHQEYHRPQPESLRISGETQYVSDIGRQITLAAGWEW